jgi:hypothetical protein
MAAMSGPASSIMIGEDAATDDGFAFRRGGDRDVDGAKGIFNAGKRVADRESERRLRGTSGCRFSAELIFTECDDGHGW